MIEGLVPPETPEEADILEAVEALDAVEAREAVDALVALEKLDASLTVEDASSRNDICVEPTTECLGVL